MLFALQMRIQLLKSKIISAVVNVWMKQKVEIVKVMQTSEEFSLFEGWSKLSWGGLKLIHNKRNGHLTALRILLVIQVFWQMHFPLDSELYFHVSVTWGRTQELWGLQVKLFYVDFLACTSSGAQVTSLGQFPSLDALSQSVLLQLKTGAAAWVCQAQAIPSAGGSCPALCRGLPSAV